MASSNGVRWGIAAGLLAAVLAGCGGGGGDPADAGRDAPDLPTADADVLDAAPDEGTRDLPPEPGPDVRDVPEADAGTPCATDGDCPQWHLCRTVVAESGSTRQCVPGPDLLCAPCSGDADCRPEGVATADRCLGTDALGRFCAVDCSLDDACPDGYECVTPPGEPAAVRQCVPAGGADCACPAVAVEQGLWTPCTRVNDAGTCTGRRACSAEGLSACDAAEAAPEACNAVDDDCDGETDEGIVYGTCAMQWGKVMCVGPRVCVLGEPTCKAGPPADETCNGYDDDCDGTTDEVGTPGCIEVWLDEDQDGIGTGASRCDCGFVPPWTARTGGDCNDRDATVHPGATEVCDGKDNDCDGDNDPPGLPDCTVAYADLDGDTFGDPASGLCLCPSDAAERVLDGTDCNDGNPDVHPGAVEACNGLDDDCDGATDDGPDRVDCRVFHADADLDGWGDLADGPCLCHADGPWATAQGGDCDDGNADVNPGAAETCNDVDDDCDGATDEDFDCDPGIEATQACGFCGSQRRTCGQDCRWPEWSACEGSKACQPGSLQPCAVGCGNLVCTDACEWPAECTWTTDAYEPNETQALARYFGYYEEPDAPPQVTGWIHGPDDVDWYSFTADEEFPIFVDTDGTLVAGARLWPGPGWHELCLLWDEGPDGNVDETHCIDGYGSDLYVETSNVDPGLLSEAYGTVFVSVRGDPACDPYQLTFTWD